jgi:hypothetical protein
LNRSVHQKLADQEAKRLKAHEGMSDAVKSMFKSKDGDQRGTGGAADFFGRTFTRVSACIKLTIPAPAESTLVRCLILPLSFCSRPAPASLAIVSIRCTSHLGMHHTTSHVPASMPASRHTSGQGPSREIVG